ncbi:hypothetical protein Elgi_68180 [Paenibacillus elgii]|uniref:ABC transporter substrate-binding protein n=1 Tax=Paenibacillus elgii TaxID=189691 RepID=UPI002D7B8D76|nr:hypothetical protein Elgi_68180 [Paenibacillus elgii]
MRGIFIKLTICLSLLVPLLASCSLPVKKEKNDKQVIRIGLFEKNETTEQYLRDQYFSLYEYSHDNTAIEFVYSKNQDPVLGTKQLLNSDNPPDIILLSYAVIGEFIDDNYLVKLDPLIARDKYDLDGLAQGVVLGLRDFGKGSLYALSPTFSSSVLIYNKNIFNKAGVSFPKDGMTWGDAFDKARQIKIKGESDSFGFSFSWSWSGELNENLSLYTEPLNLHEFDKSGKKMTINTPEWENAWTTIFELYREKVIPNEEDIMKFKQERKSDNGAINDNAFLSGKVAMTIMSYRNFLRMHKIQKASGGQIPFEWDVATIPVHPGLPNTGTHVPMEPVLAINSKSPNIEISWELIKFICGDEWARGKANSMDNLLARTKYNKPKEGLDYNINAFYKLKPPAIDLDIARQYLNKPDLHHVTKLGEEKLKKALKGEVSVKEALSEWESEGNNLLKKIEANQTIDTKNRK